MTNLNANVMTVNKGKTNLVSKGQFNKNTQE